MHTPHPTPAARPDAGRTITKAVLRAADQLGVTARVLPRPSASAKRPCRA